jgi:hypothetical protein
MITHHLLDDEDDFLVNRRGTTIAAATIKSETQPISIAFLRFDDLTVLSGIVVTVCTSSTLITDGG